MTAPRRPPRAPLVGLAVVAALAAVALTSGATAAPHDATGTGALPAAPHQAPPPGQDETVRLELMDQTLAVEADGDIRLAYLLRELDGDPLELATTTTAATTTTTSPPTTTDPFGAQPVPELTETTTTAPPPVELKLQVVNYAPLTDPAVVGRVVGGDIDPAVFDALRTVDGVELDARAAATVADDGTTTFELEVGTDVENSQPDRLKFEAPGVYPLRIQLIAGDGDDETVVATAGTVVQRLPGAGDAAAPHPIDLAVVVATPELPPAAAPPLAAEARAAFDAAIRFADDFDGAAAFRLPPSLVADAADRTDTGDDIDNGDAPTIDEALADDELVATPSVPLDVSSAVAADRADTYTRLVTTGEDLMRDAVPTTPTRRDLSIATSPVSAPGAELLRDLGTRFVVMTADAYRDSISDDLPPTDQFVAATLPDGGTLPMIVVDPLGSQLTAAAAEVTLSRRTAIEWAVQTSGELLLEQQADDLTALTSGSARPNRGRILATPDLSAPDVRLLNALAELTATTPSIRFTAASALGGVVGVHQVDGQPFTVDLPAVAGPSLTDRIELLESTALTMASAATMLPPGDPRPDEWTTELDALVSTAYTDADVLAATAEMHAEADRLRSSIVLPEPFTFTLTGRSGTIEVRLTNTADEELNVLVALDSAKLTFPAGDQTVTLRPAGETSVIVPVEARSNGTSSIELRVSTPAGEALGPPVPLTATVRALTGLGQVLTAGFVLVLATWWFSHWRARRRAAVEPAADVSAEPSTDAPLDTGADAPTDTGADADAPDTGAAAPVESDSL